MRILDAASCAGVGADGYAEVGLEVVCLDNDPKALRHNPHETVCGNMLEFLADRGFMAQFDAVHASPPCQGYSATRHLAAAQGKGGGPRTLRLLEPVRDLLMAWGGPWIMENVPRSPLRSWPGVVQLCGSAFGLKVQRHRLFAPSPGLVLTGTGCLHDRFDIDPITGRPRPWGVYYAAGDNIPSGGRTARDLEHGLAVMGVERTLPWRYLCEGLPPAYTRHLGTQLIEALG